MAAMYRQGGFGYGQVKKQLADAAEAYFADARDRRARLAEDRSYVQDVLREGAQRARTKAAEVLARAQRACGVR